MEVQSKKFLICNYEKNLKERMKRQGKLAGENVPHRGEITLG
jgi:hypothetical protein